MKLERQTETEESTNS